MGILDYGNCYATKTGSTYQQAGSLRCVAFGFTGRKEPTAPSGCGRSLLLPRDLNIVHGNQLGFFPIPELAVLRSSSTVTTDEPNHPLSSGSQVDLRLECSGVLSVAKAGVKAGRVGLRTLKGDTEIGYDFADGKIYLDHSRCCSHTSAIVQRSQRLPAALIGDVLEIRAWVDGSIVEAFASNLTFITGLVSPDIADGSPALRGSDYFVDASLAPHLVRVADSWRLAC